MSEVVLKYTEYKHLIENADVLLFKRGKFPNAGWWIGKYTQSLYSHAALAYVEDGEVFCLEFREGKKSRKHSLKEYLEQGCEIDVFRALQMVKYPKFVGHHVGYYMRGLDEITRDKIIKMALTLMGRRYGWWNIWQLAKNYMPFIRLRPVKVKADDIDPRLFVCSTLVSYCYRMCYIDPIPFVADTQTTPGDLARSRLFCKLFGIIL